MKKLISLTLVLMLALITVINRFLLRNQWQPN